MLPALRRATSLTGNDQVETTKMQGAMRVAGRMSDLKFLEQVAAVIRLPNCG
jgi:hypothetical protein